MYLPGLRGLRGYGEDHYRVPDPAGRLWSPSHFPCHPGHDLLLLPFRRGLCGYGDDHHRVSGPVGGMALRRCVYTRELSGRVRLTSEMPQLKLTQIAADR